MDHFFISLKCLISEAISLCSIGTVSRCIDVCQCFCSFLEAVSQCASCFRNWVGANGSSFSIVIASIVYFDSVLICVEGKFEVNTRAKCNALSGCNLIYNLLGVCLVQLI